MHPQDNYPAAASPDQPPPGRYTPPRLGPADSDARYAAGLLGELYRVAECDADPERQRRARLVLDWDFLSAEQRAARLLPSAIVAGPAHPVTEAPDSLEK